ncbi:unnamed protein product [Urochloa decumbens]|uniref:Uncharacterized protein n=1 Tax=Urochloa decumbens TaxID=240449 RepID=A0ABC8YHQ4_9POAL
MLPAAVAGMLPRRQAIARASVSALVASLPLLYVSLLRPPPAALAGDTAFWFLMSNCVIAAIVATSDDAGTLLFRSAAAADDPLCDSGGRSGGGLYYGASAGQHPVPVQAVMVPFPASPQQDVPPAVDMNGGRVQREVASAVTSSYSTNHALPSLIEGEEEDVDDAASEPSVVETNHPVRRDEKEEVATEPSTVKSNRVEVEALKEEEDSDEVIPLATIEEGSELAEPEPWSPRVLRSTKSLPEEEAADVEWPIPPYSRPADETAQDKGVAAAREGGLRRSATVGSKPEEESEYWQLSDEELNRRVEDFIARFNREMRRQVEQEAGI